MIVFAIGAASAQTAPAPLVGASAAPGAATTSEAIEAAEAMKRARRLAENPYRWIKIHADTQRKPDLTKPRAHTETATVEAPRPTPRPSVSEATATLQETATPRETAPVVTTVKPPAGTSDSVSAPVPVAASEVSAAAAAPASVPTSAQTAAASPPPDDHDDVELKPISTPPPEFPRELRNSVSTGRVIVVFTVQTNGAVGETKAESSTNRRLSKVALEAVNQWKFEPIASEVTYKVEFAFTQ